MMSLMFVLGMSACGTADRSLLLLACDDGNPCTVDWPVSGPRGTQCMHSNEPDFTICGEHVCMLGTHTVSECTTWACTTSEDCFVDQCSAAVCDGGQCRWSAYQDGQVCFGADASVYVGTCEQGVCAR